MQTIIPHLWFDTQALEAAKVYTSLIPDSQIDWTHELTDTPSGNAVLLQFQLANLTLAAISAGPYFKLNESASLMVHFQDKAELDRVFQDLSEGGRILMPLGDYPFNPHYVWFEDRFGLSWQFLLNPQLDKPVHLDICLLFSEEQVGLAKPFLEEVLSIFPESQKGQLSYYQEGEKQVPAAQLNYGELLFGDQKLVVMDHGYGGVASFNEAFSLMVYTESQEETSRFYELLSHEPKAEQCGWVKDRFGLSWQIVPRPLMTAAYEELSKEQMKEVNDAVLSMKRLDYDKIASLTKKSC